MYRQIVHFLQGQVLVRIECGCPERMLNLCGARGIPFWELTWESPVCLTLRAVGRDLPRLRQAAEDAGGSLHLCRSGGVPVFWRRLRRRYVLLAGAVLALVLMFGGNLVIRSAATTPSPRRPFSGRWRTTASPWGRRVCTSIRRPCATMCCWPCRRYRGWR